MREIEFRGKRLDNGEWVYGSLFNTIWRYHEDKTRVCYIFPDDMIDAIDGDSWEDFAYVAEDYELDPATVGQYTGLKDKNGKKIYEGDIVKSGRIGRLYVIIFSDGMFYASVNEFNKELCGGFPLHTLTTTEESGYECEVVGNIYDENPELIRKGKQYVITLAKTFPVRHPKAGEDTYFRDSYENRYKIHTIRCNVPLWQKRIKEVEAGKACLSIREWSGRPYNSNQIEIARLTKEDGVGMQVMKVNKILNRISFDNADLPIDPHDVATNDGLSFMDWVDWFKFDSVPHGAEFAIIHFTPFRY